MSELAPPVALHSVSSWLPMTMNWVYHQVRHTPGFTAVALADARENEALFPVGALYLPERPGPRLVRRARRLLGLRRTPPNYHAAVARHRPALLHSHFGDRGWFDLPLAWRHRLPHVVTFYGYDVGMLPRKQPYWRLRYRELFARADRFLCEGEFMAASLVALGCPAEKVRVQRLGVEVGEIAYRPRRRAEGEPLKVLIAGSFREKKGIPYALEALGLLHARGAAVAITLIGDSSGSARDEAEKRRIGAVISRYNLGPVTRMLGYQPYATLLEEAYASHVFLSPSVTAADGDSEGGAPVSLIDMAASGMPIVSTTHCDIPGVVAHGENGLLAPERDAAALAEHLAWLDAHPERWAGMAAAGRRRVEERFDARAQGAALGAIYRELAG